MQKGLGRDIVHAFEIAFVVHHDEVVHRAVVEHVFVRLDELVESLPVATYHPKCLHDRNLKVAFNRHVLFDDFLILQLFKIFRKLEFTPGSRLHEVPKE